MKSVGLSCFLFLFSLTCLLTPSFVCSDEMDDFYAFARLVDHKDFSAAFEMIDAGLPVDTKKSDNETLLMYAIGSGNIDLVRFLLAKGADVNAQNIAGGTPLMWAAAAGRIDIVLLLVENGADPLIQDAYNRTATNLAQQQGFPVLAEFLLEASGN